MEQKKQAIFFTTLLKQHFGKRLVAVVLFGSVARGTSRSDSDIDLLVVLEDLGMGRLKRQELLEPVYQKALKKGCNSSINCHLKTPSEANKISLYYFDFPGEAKVLHDTGNFLRGIIGEVKRIIKRNGAVRKKWGKFYYWDLRPGTRADQTVELL